MRLDRREFVAVVVGAMGATRGIQLDAPQETGGRMYGLIARFTAVAGQRESLAHILIEGTSQMPGCLSYVVASDSADPSSLWVTEIWDSQASHKASLQLPAVQAAMARGRPLIADLGDRVETTPIGGHGIR
jgi:quinol monooxygenase YgiN